jgi:hypothetical protein
MDNLNLELAKKDIEEALEAVEAMEETLSTNKLSKDALKEKFELLAMKVDQLEKILIEEGIISE